MVGRIAPPLLARNLLWLLAAAAPALAAASIPHRSATPLRSTYTPAATAAGTSTGAHAPTAHAHSIAFAIPEAPPTLMPLPPAGPSRTTVGLDRQDPWDPSREAEQAISRSRHLEFDTRDPWNDRFAPDITPSTPQTIDTADPWI